MLPIAELVVPFTQGDSSHKEEKPPVCVSEVSMSSSCQGVGFGGLVLSTLEHIAVCDRLRMPIVVRWTDCSPYCGARVNGTNYWTYFFENIQTLNKKYVAEYGALCCGDTPFDMTRLTTLPDFAFHPEEEEEGLRGGQRTAQITAKLRKGVNRIIKKYIHPLPSLQKKVDAFVQRSFNGRTVIGVHVRGTDRWGEVRVHRTMEASSWVRKVHEFLSKFKESLRESNRPLALFVASDNGEAIQIFHQHFKKHKIEVVSTTTWRAQSMHAGSWDEGITAGDGVSAGKGVLVDILLLSHCHYMIHGESSVAALAAYFNPDLQLVYASVSEAARWQSRGLSSEKREKMLGHVGGKVKSWLHPLKLSDEMNEGSKYEKGQRFDSDSVRAHKVVPDASVQESEEKEDTIKCLTRNSPFTVCQATASNFRQIGEKNVNETLGRICRKFCRPGDSLEQFYSDGLWG